MVGTSVVGVIVGTFVGIQDVGLLLGETVGVVLNGTKEGKGVGNFVGDTIVRDLLDDLIAGLLCSACFCAAPIIVKCCAQSALSLHSCTTVYVSQVPINIPDIE